MTLVCRALGLSDPAHDHLYFAITRFLKFMRFYRTLVLQSANLSTLCAHAPDELSTAHKQYLYAGIALFLREGDHVLIDVDRRDDLLPFHDALHRLKLIAQRGGPFKVKFFGGLGHFVAGLADDPFAVTAQEIHQVLDAGAVFVAVDVADARRVAQLISKYRQARSSLPVMSRSQVR